MIKITGLSAIIYRITQITGLFSVIGSYRTNNRDNLRFGSYRQLYGRLYTITVFSAVTVVIRRIINDNCIMSRINAFIFPFERYDALYGGIIV